MFAASYIMVNTNEGFFKSVTKFYVHRMGQFAILNVTNSARLKSVLFYQLL